MFSLVFYSFLHGWRGHVLRDVTSCKEMVENGAVFN